MRAQTDCLRTVDGDDQRSTNGWDLERARCRRLAAWLMNSDVFLADHLE